MNLIGLLFLSGLAAAAEFQVESEEEQKDLIIPGLTAFRPEQVRGTDGACTNEQLRRLIFENMTDNTSETKRLVHAALSSRMEGSWAVICAECAFSYLAHAQDYCIHTKNNITCLVYRE